MVKMPAPVLPWFYVHVHSYIVWKVTSDYVLTLEKKAQEGL